jgi:hypothetical protein
MSIPEAYIKLRHVNIKILLKMEGNIVHFTTCIYNGSNTCNVITINDVDFINYVNKFDIVGFVETLVSDSPGNLPEYSLPFTVKPSRRKRRG